MPVRKPSFTIGQLESEEKVKREDDVRDKRKEEKEFVTVFQNGFTYIKLTAGGSLPKVLQGAWTTATKAEKAIKDYLRDRDATATG